MLRSFMIAAMLMLASSQANALTCAEIRRAVQSYGEPTVISWALRNGYTEAEIIRLKRVCRI